MFITRETIGPFARQSVDGLEPAETLEKAITALRAWAEDRNYTVAVIDIDDDYPGLAANAAISRIGKLRLFTIEDEALAASLAAE